MVVSVDTAKQITDIMLRRMSRVDALALARDLMEVPGNESYRKTMKLVYEKLASS